MSAVPKVLVIRSSEWLRGKATRLWDGSRGCCLGLLARECGLSGHTIYRAGTPLALSYQHPGSSARSDVMSTFLDLTLSDEGSREWVIAAISVNDAPLVEDNERIENLRPLFARVGITLDWRPDE